MACPDRNAHIDAVADRSRHEYFQEIRVIVVYFSSLANRECGGSFVSQRMHVCMAVWDVQNTPRPR